MSLETWIAEAERPKGTPVLTIVEALTLVRRLRDRANSVHSMECFRVLPDHNAKPLSLEHSILGLDGPRNWESHEDHEIAYELATEKLTDAKRKGLELEIIIWV